MATPRRLGGPEAKNRVALIEAAEAVMLEEGYAAVTSRRVAAKAGLKPQLMWYYFRTMDDLFVSVFRRRGEDGLARLAKVVDSPQPLRSLWEFSLDAKNIALTREFLALANHRKVIRAEIGRYAERVREMQLEVLTEVLGSSGTWSEELPLDALAVLMTGIPRILVMEEEIGLSTGHAATLALAERWLRRLEEDPVRREE